MHELRLQVWPGGIQGKAHDTTVLCKWLLAVVSVGYDGLREGHDAQLNISPCEFVCVFVLPVVSACGCFMCLARSEKAPTDGFALLKWTLEAVNAYFRALPKRQVWIHKSKAVSCIRHCRNFTVPWLHTACVRAGITYANVCKILRKAIVR